MMGYRDPNENDDVAAYWDEYVEDFGLAAYIETRYLDAYLDQHGTDIIYSHTVPCPRCGEVHPV